MGNLLKKWWVFATVFMVAGMALIAVGWGIGARGTLVYVNRDGIHVSSRDEKGPTVSEKDLEEFTSIDASTVSAEIELVPSDHYGLEARLPAKSGEITWSNENGTLSIKADHDWPNWDVFIFDFDSYDYYVKVYYPDDASFENVNISTASGEIDVTETSVKNLSAKTVSGEINANVRDSEEVKLTSTSGSIDLNGDNESTMNVEIKTISGSVDVNNAIWRLLTASTTSGSVKISGDAQGPSSVKSVSGGVEVGLHGAAEDYAYDVSSVSGSIRVDEQHVGSPAVSTSGSSDKAISIKTTSGSVKLDFEG